MRHESPRRDDRDCSTRTVDLWLGVAWWRGDLHRHAYVLDVRHRRILRVRLDYAAKATCEVK
jgi:hypothetical protein